MAVNMENIMSTQCLEKNKKLIRAYCTILRVAGWVLMAGGVAVVVWYAIFAEGRDSRAVRYFLLPSGVVSFLYPGILALVLAQLITYIFDHDYRPGWFLRRADKVMYVYATLVLLQSVLPYFYASSPSTWWEIPVGLLLMTAKLVIVLGLGRLVRLVMPMIEESRTLV